MKGIVGRTEETVKLAEYYASGKAEFVAIYGRRRVGKTFLIDTHFNQNYDFYMSGVIEGSKEDQLYAFNQSLKKYGGSDLPLVKNWNDAFACLRCILESKLNKKRLLIFIDELPCLDTARSGFVKALDSFWNTWASKHSNVMLVVCGSATSWMVENIIDSHGGLHNRITREMHLKPFKLAETEKYLVANGIRWDRLTVSQCYMIFGGIPYYLSLLRPAESLAQNIDRLFFSEDGELKREYSRLFHALFRKPEKYIKVIESLAKSRSGLSRNELIENTTIASGEDLSKILKNLEYCDFIRRYSISGNAANTKNCIYQIVDFFTLFHLKFCKRPTTDTQWWSHNLGKSTQSDWFGIMFEILCINHIAQIKTALSIAGIHSEYAAWRSNGKEKAQIDLILDRADRIINLCELKYSKSEYALDKAEADKLLRRQSIYEQETCSRKGIQRVLVTTYGLKPGKYSSLIEHVITLNDLFSK